MAILGPTKSGKSRGREGSDRKANRANQVMIQAVTFFIP